MAENVDRETATTKPITAGWSPDRRLELARGSEVGRFVILGPLGRGGMGVVFAAYDPRLDRKLALKFLWPDVAKAAERLLREAQAQAKLSHPNVVRVHDVGSYEGTVFMAMELVEGVTLRKWLEPNRPWRDVLKVFLEAGRGLAAAHAAGLVHRDFTPGNVLVGADDHPHVTDFGLARSLSSLGTPPSGPHPERGPKLIDERLTRADVVAGTLPYIAPEQFLGQDADARSDQFSFCVALYEGLYRERPFEAFPDGVSDEARRHQAASRTVRPAPAGSRVPARLRRVLVQGLAADPTQRFPSMKSLLDTLGRDPAAAQRRALVAVGGLLVAGLGGFLVWSQLGDREAVCQGADRRLVGVWDAGRKQVIHAAFVAAAQPYATESWAATERSLDGYTRAWVSTHTSVCEATHVHGERSQDDLSLGMRCLDQRMRELGSLTDLFAAADRQVVLKSVDAAASLPDPAMCENLVLLRSPVPLPESAELRAAIDGLRVKLARASALRESGKLVEGLAVVEPLLGEVSRLGYRPLEAEALFFTGALLGQSQRFREARTTLIASLVAAEAGHHDEFKIRAGIGLAFMRGYLEQQAAEGHLWLDLAAATLERTGGLDEWVVRSENTRGLILLEEGRYDEAEKKIAKALDHAERALGATHPLTLTVLSNTALLLNRRGDSEAAVEVNRRVLTARSSVLGEAHLDTLMSMNNLGFSLALAGRTDEALRILARALAVAEREHGPDSPQLTYVLGSIAFAHLERGDLVDARDVAGRLLRIVETSYGRCHPRTFEALHVRGSALRRAGHPALALRDLGACPAADGGFAVPLLTAQGEALIDLGRLSEASIPLERAKRVLDQTPGAAPHQRGAVLFALARAVDSKRAGRPRAIELAIAAKDAFGRSRMPRAKQDRERVHDWLAARTPEPTASSKN